MKNETVPETDLQQIAQPSRISVDEIFVKKATIFCCKFALHRKCPTASRSASAVLNFCLYKKHFFKFLKLTFQRVLIPNVIQKLIPVDYIIKIKMLIIGFDPLKFL